MAGQWWHTPQMTGVHIPQLQLSVWGLEPNSCRHEGVLVLSLCLNYQSSFLALVPLEVKLYVWWQRSIAKSHPESPLFYLAV